MNEKQKELERIISECESAIVAFSGGVDSTYLAYIAYQMLKDKMLAVTVKAPFIPAREVREASEIASKYSFPHRIIYIENFENESFLNNPPDRCYHCKKEIFGLLKKIASVEGFKSVCEGTNADDEKSHRPGVKAIKELNIRSPLLEAGLTKADIRELSAQSGLPTAYKPSYACLASRFPYGLRLTAEGFRRVERAEDILFLMGFNGHRVRDHYPIARIELVQSEIPRLLDKDIIKKVVNEFKKLGYRFVTIDLEGYRSGCFDEESK